MPTSAASAMLVAITLRRIRGRASLATMRGPIDHRDDRSEPEHDQRVAEQAVAEPTAPRAERGTPRRSACGRRRCRGDRGHRRSRGGPRGRGASAGTASRAAGRVRSRATRLPRRDGEERAVRAVVEDDERAHQEGGRRDQRARAAAGRDTSSRQPHRHRQGEVGHDGRSDTEERSSGVRPGERRELLAPLPRLAARRSRLSDRRPRIRAHLTARRAAAHDVRAARRLVHPGEPHRYEAPWRRRGNPRGKRCSRARRSSLMRNRANLRAHSENEPGGETPPLSELFKVASVGDRLLRAQREAALGLRVCLSSKSVADR